MPSRRRRRGDPLGTRALNRALLERQLLLRRRRVSLLDAVERLVALQAQVPRDPYVALWSRLDRFRPEVLSEALAERRAVRMTLHRATLHLVSARDALALRPRFQPVVDRMFHGQAAFRRAAEAAGPERVTEIVLLLRSLLEERPGTRSDLTRAVAERWPELDGASLGYLMYLLPTVQVTPRGLWRTPGRAAVTTLEHWLGRPLADPGATPEHLARRYLRAFGPARPADFASWSGLAGVREVFERLRPELRTFRGEDGRELFDLPGAPLPDPDTPAPVRFLPEFDNALLGFADRRRIVPQGTPLWTEVGWGGVLVDGFLAARWRAGGAAAGTTLVVEPFRRLSPAEKAEIADEGARLLGFLEPDAEPHDIRVATRARVTGNRPGARRA
jgi:Winged helix DNA-binding domain